MADLGVAALFIVLIAGALGIRRVTEYNYSVCGILGHSIYSINIGDRPALVCRRCGYTDRSYWN